jgi:hypothetical protein
MSKTKASSAHQLVESIETHFEGLTDLRVPGRTKHSMLNIIVISLLAMMSGQTTWDDIEEYAELKRDWLSTFLVFPEGGSTPSSRTLSRVFAMLNPKCFNECVSAWLQALHASIVQHGDDGSLAIDGKVLRGTAQTDGSGGVCMVMALGRNIMFITFITPPQVLLKISKLRILARILKGYMALL